MEQHPSLTPDDDVFKHLATIYAQNHPRMHNGTECHDTSFPGGIVNGAAWYSFDGIKELTISTLFFLIYLQISGGMSDYNYAFHGCYELTLEISCCKFPHPTELPMLWEENKKSLVEFIKEAHKGVTGIVLDDESNLPINWAVLTIKGRDIDFYTSQFGEFWRLLLPGSYTLRAQAEGYFPTEVDFEVKSYEAFPRLTQLKVFMVNITKPTTTTATTSTTTITATTTTSTTTAATTTKMTILPSTKKSEVTMQGKIITLDEPIHSKQLSSSNADVSGAYTFYASLTSSIVVAILLMLF